MLKAINCLSYDIANLIKFYQYFNCSTPLESQINVRLEHSIRIQ